jgi:hypothetical protein
LTCLNLSPEPDPVQRGTTLWFSTICLDQRGSGPEIREFA